MSKSTKPYSTRIAARTLQPHDAAALHDSGLLQYADHHHIYWDRYHQCYCIPGPNATPEMRHIATVGEVKLMLKEAGVPA